MPKWGLVKGWRGFGLGSETANLADVPTHIPLRSDCYLRFCAFSGQHLGFAAFGSELLAVS